MILQTEIKFGKFAVLLFLKPAFHHRILQNDRLVAFGSGRNQADFDAD
jgi:hypothetical protein